MKKQCLLMMVGVMLFALACKKTNPDDPQLIFESKVPVPAEIVQGSANPINPYDSAGYLHNVILASIMKRVNVEKNSSPDFIHAAAVEAARQTGVRLTEASKNAALTISKDANNKFVNVISSMSCSNEAKNWLRKLVKVLTDTSGISSGEYPMLRSKIVVIEKDILAEHSLTEKDKYIVLGATSVARYSLSFWLMQNNSDVGTTPSARSFNLLRFICVGLADVFGFAFNAAVGGDGSGLAGAAAAGAEASADGNSSLNYIPGNPNIFN